MTYLLAREVPPEVDGRLSGAGDRPSEAPILDLPTPPTHQVAAGEGLDPELQRRLEAVREGDRAVQEEQRIAISEGGGPIIERAVQIHRSLRGVGVPLDSIDETRFVSNQQLEHHLRMYAPQVDALEEPFINETLSSLQFIESRDKVKLHLEFKGRCILDHYQYAKDRLEFTDLVGFFPVKVYWISFFEKLTSLNQQGNLPFDVDRGSFHLFKEISILQVVFSSFNHDYDKKSLCLDSNLDQEIRFVRLNRVTRLGETRTYIN